MRKITKEEFETFSRGHSNPIVNALWELEVGEGLEISFDEWNVVSTPYCVVQQKAKREGRKFSLHTRKQERVWLLLRTI